ncbi:MCP four helix bundle domain-containing protein [Clostridium botulinum]|nr:MCP four helix bundle domain-containing protein [Clostridium botulinum]
MLKTIKNKLIFLVCILIGAIIFMGVYSIKNLNNFNEKFSEVSNYCIPGIMNSEKLNTMTAEFRLLQYNHIISSDRQVKKQREIQNITFKVIESVKNLSDSSSDLLTFVATDIDNDYKTMLTVADQYSQDANFVDTLVTDFSSTSEELLASLQDVVKTIEGVAQAANEGAGGTTDITGKILEVNNKSNDVLNEALKSEESSNKLKREISKFKI